MSLVEWCEAKVTRNTGFEFFNSFSNLAFILVATSPRYTATNVAIRLVGIGSFLFHATESQIGQLMDEIPMSIVAYLYYINVCNLANISCYKTAYLAIMLGVWTAYIQYKLYPLFVAFFLGQLTLPIVILFVHVPKNNFQMRQLIVGSRFIGFSVGCWIFERYFYLTDQCPIGLLDPLYYLHSYWHIGMALAHYHMMKCIDVAITP
jgi:hypothetical protein